MARVCTHCHSTEFASDLCRESEELTVVTDRSIITFARIPGLRCKQCDHFYYSAKAIEKIKQFQDGWESLGAVPETNTIMDMDRFVQLVH